MARPEADIVVVGAGCAGLSLAVHLLEQGIGDRRVLLLDARESFGRDRTWCFFRVMEHPFAGAVSHRYRRWLVRDHERTVERGSTAHPYEHLPSDAFYGEALARIEPSDAVRLELGTRVEEILDRGDTARVVTDRGDIEARVVLDGRPGAAEVRRKDGDVRFLQHFRGWFIRTEEPVFDPETATLMDFAVAQDDGIHFVYVLPFSAHDALVEDTYFGFEPLPAERYDENLERWLSERGIERYEVTHREQGVLPMTTEDPVGAPSHRVLRIGLAAGLARPATGYAFLAIQRHSAELARRLRSERLPEPPRPRSRRTLFLDRVFLSHLAAHPDEAPALFVRMFDEAPPDALARFLSEASSVPDDLRIMAALPKLPLTRAALQSRSLWWGRT